MPTELPQIIVVILGALSPLAIQFVKKSFKERWARLVAAVVFSGGVGVAAYYVAKPEGLDLADTLAYIYAASGLAYSAFWKPIWGKLVKE